MADILIYDAIYEDSWGMGGVSARAVRAQLVDLGAFEDVTVRINSPGGVALDGVAIYTALNQHKGKVTVIVEGMAASAASVVAMAGDEIRIAQGAMFMVHEAAALCMGRAEDMLAAAEMLRKTTDELITIYTARTGLSTEEVASLLAAETWMGAVEAKKRGFADAIDPAKAKPAPDTKAGARAMASYRHVPEALLRTPPSNSAPRAPARAAIATPMAQLSRRP